VASKKPDPASIRSSLKAKLGDEIAEEMATSIRAALQSTKIEWIDCEKCKKRTPFAIPNMFERVKAAQLVLSELEGKVGTHREAPAPAKVSLGDLGELSDEQLLELLQAPEGADEESEEHADLG
jgi:hypothetical protein